jgi:hypothetical protein
MFDHIRHISDKECKGGLVENVEKGRHFLCARH